MRTDDEIARAGVLGEDSWMITASGAKLNFLNPQLYSINLADIAMHCGNICRFTGATSQFYSVAQHSVFVGRVVKRILDDEGVDRDMDYWDQILAGLLHDSEEAYVNDLSSPLKSAIRGKYKWIATGIRRKVFEKYGIDWEYMNKIVKEADNVAIIVERYYLMPDHPDWPKVSAGSMDYLKPVYQAPEQATQAFMDTLRYALLQRDMARTDTAPDPVAA